MEAFNAFSGMGLFAAGLGFAYAQYKSGGNKAKDDLIGTLKETAVVERDKAQRLAEEKITLMQSHQEQINQLNIEIGRLKGLNEANATKIKEYMDILQGRSPEQTKFMDYMTKVAAESSKYMNDSASILKDIKDFLENEKNERIKGVTK